MEIRQLRYFLEICRSRSITKAAQNIHISQQSLSRQLKLFEDELGVRLFVRTINGVELTGFAEKLMPHAKRIIKEADDAAKEIEELRSSDRFTLRLGLVRGDFNMNSALSPAVIFDWEQKHPNMSLEIRELEPDEPDRFLLLSELDLAYTNSDCTEGLTKVSVSSEPAYVLINAGNPLARKSELSAADLADESFLISGQNPLPDKVRRQLASALGFEPRFVPYNGTFEQGIEHVRTGKGILIAGRAFFLSRNLNGLSAVPFPGNAYTFDHCLAWRSDRELPPAVKDLIETLKKR